MRQPFLELTVALNYQRPEHALLLISYWEGVLRIL
jgi:hypothetical protein